jgi:hypothetical protein
MTNVIQFPSRLEAMPSALSSPAFLHGWPFLAVIETDDTEALPIRGHARDNGPTIEFNPVYLCRESLEDWSIARHWLSPCLMQIAAAALAEGLDTADGIGRFSSPRWHAFHDAVACHMTMPWLKIIEATRREGVDFMADNAAACLIIESGLTDRLETA